MDGSPRGRGSPLHGVVNSLPLLFKQTEYGLLNKCGSPFAGRAPPTYTSPQRLEAGPPWRQGLLPSEGVWKQRGGSGSDDKKKDRRREEGNKLSGMGLLASCARRLILLAPPWSADLGFRTLMWENFNREIDFIFNLMAEQQNPRGHSSI